MNKSRRAMCRIWGKSVYGVWWGSVWGKCPLERPRHRRGIVLKRILKRGWEGTVYVINACELFHFNMFCCIQYSFYKSPCPYWKYPDCLALQVTVLCCEISVTYRNHLAIYVLCTSHTPKCQGVRAIRSLSPASFAFSNLQGPQWRTVLVVEKSSYFKHSVLCG